MKKIILFSMMTVLGASCAREQQALVIPNTSASPMGTSAPGKIVDGYRVGIAPDNVSTLKEVHEFNGTLLASLPRTATRVTYSVSLETLGGEILTHGSQVLPSTEYRIIIKGQSGVRYHIQQYDGFELIKNEATVAATSEEKQSPTQTCFLIKTSAETNKEVFIKIVPLVTENSILQRAPGKSFSLVDYNE